MSIKHTNKKIIVFLTFLLLIFTLNLNVKAEDPEIDYILGRPMTEEEISEQEEIIEEHSEGNGFVEPDILTSSLQTGAAVISSGSEFGMDSGSLPSEYDPRTAERQILPAIRNQGSFGICWVYSTIACCEINLCKKGLANANNIDLSEGHLAYYARVSAPDPLGNGVDDSSTFDTYEILNIPGNGFDCYRALKNWKGLVDESTMGVFSVYDVIDDSQKNTTELAYGKDKYHLKEFKVLTYNANDVSNIKQAVNQYGAAVINYYAANDTVNQYYNYSTAAQYYDGEYGADHAVCIVGWDDNYSKDNFTTKPSKDGAWIIRNSWGTYYGDEGYFYLSYEDKSIYQDIYVFDVELANDYENIYQYDNIMFSEGLSSPYSKVANIYTAKATDSSSQEKIEAVGFSVFAFEDSSLDYSVQIYSNPTNLKNPTTGNALLTTPISGTIYSPGFYQIEIPEDVIINNGDKFAVVIEFPSATGTIYLEKEVSYTANYRGVGDVIVGSWVNTSGNCDGQTVGYVSSGKYWSDAGNAFVRGNFVIKAYTSKYTNSNQGPTNTDPIKCTSITINKSNVSLKTGDTIQLNASVLPENANDRSVTWLSNNTSVAKVDSTGKVTAIGIGTAVISAKTNDGTNLQKDCTINVKSPFEVSMSVPSGYSTTELYVDGIAYNAVISSNKYELTLNDGNAKSIVAYKYNSNNVPIGMYVWTLHYENKTYTATAQAGLEDLLTYHGFSIRTTGKSGIRFKTGISSSMRGQLTSTGINGYSLKEYGTLVMYNDNRSQYPFIKGGNKVKTGMAYGIENGTLKDSIFETVNGRYRYTSVLVGLPASQYKVEYAFRGYAVLTNNGEEIVIYGPPVSRSIYTLANQALSMKTYPEGSSQDLFLKKIISDAQ